jgi:hypothetical protein
MQTYTVQDYKAYSVEAKVPAGKTVVKDASHPTSVNVNQEFAWYVVGQVTDGVVRNPGVAYYYKDGPAASVKIVKNDGTEIDLPKGSALVLYVKGDQPVGTTIDSRNAFRGAKFPAAGTYTIWLCAGYVSDAEAAMGKLSLGGLYELVTPHLEGFEGSPFLVDVWPINIIVSALTMGFPLLVVAGVIAANELSK